MTDTHTLPTDLSAVRKPLASHVVIPIAILSTLSVVARLYSRKLKKLQLAAHDYLIIGGLVLAWGCAGTAIRMERYGMGRHIEVVPMATISKLFKTVFSFAPIFGTTILVIKASIILFLRQVFPLRRVVVPLYIISAIVFVWWATAVFMGIFLCDPIRGQWEKDVPSKCLNTKQYYIATGIPNTITDLALLAIPIVEVWKLQMARTHKISISGIFVLGAFVCAASTVRVVYLFQEAEDITWELYDEAVWGSIEPSTGVICACIPTILPAIELTIFKPVRNLSSTLQSLFRHSPSHASDSATDPRIDNGSRNFQRLEDSPRSHSKGGEVVLGSNATVIKAEGSFDEERDSVLLANISVRRDVDVERNDRGV